MLAVYPRLGVARAHHPLGWVLSTR